MPSMPRRRLAISNKEEIAESLACVLKKQSSIGGMSTGGPVRPSQEITILHRLTNRYVSGPRADYLARLDSGECVETARDVKASLL
jgi:hypothetical protein